MGSDPIETVHVVAGVIRDDRGRILVGRRHDDTHQGGLWEFPGGKLDPGEEPSTGLARELTEEIGITVTRAEPLIKVRYAYPDRPVLLDIWEVRNFEGEPAGLERQQLRWVTPDELVGLEMPPADRPVINAVRLPEHYVISGGDPGNPEAFLTTLDAALGRGVRLVQLRAKTLPRSELKVLAARAAELCQSREARLLLNAEPELVTELGLDGVHLTAARLMAARERPLSEEFWVGASCHNREELDHAHAVGADFVTLSPVCPAASHPNASPLGWDRFAELCDASQLPVYALGGLSSSDIKVAREHGGQGLAGISAFWRD